MLLKFFHPASGSYLGLANPQQAENLALPGSRTAINISGIRTGQIERGHVIAHPGTYQPSKMIDVWARLLPDVADPLKHNTEVKLFVGASEVMARARVLGMPELAPGRMVSCTMLEDPIVVRRQDVLLFADPHLHPTIGGGQIVDAHPKCAINVSTSNDWMRWKSCLLERPGNHPNLIKAGSNHRNRSSAHRDWKRSLQISP